MCRQARFDGAVVGQADGTYKIQNADNSYSGKYLFCLKNPDGEVIWSSCSVNGSIDMDPWEDCTIEVRTISWVIGGDTQSVAFTLSPITTVTDIVLCTAPTETSEVATYDELVAALKKGGTVKLTADITSSNAMMTMTRPEATLILNGHTLDICELRIYYGKHLTIDGTVFGSKICYSSGTNTVGTVLYSTLIINGGAYQEIRNDRSTVIITSGSFTTDPSQWVDTTKYTVTNNGYSTWTVTALDSGT